MIDNEPHIAKLEADLSEAKGIVASLSRDLQVEKIKMQEDNARIMRLVEAVEGLEKERYWSESGFGPGGGEPLSDDEDWVKIETLAAEIKEKQNDD